MARQAEHGGGSYGATNSPGVTQQKQSKNQSREALEQMHFQENTEKKQLPKTQLK